MGTRPSPQAYKEVTCVLSLGWTEDCVDTEISSEVSITRKRGKESSLYAAWETHPADLETEENQLLKLRRILQNSYHFSVRFERMHAQICPQMQAAEHVGDFVREEDQSERLLVVYYAGHGRAGKDSRLVLAGSLTWRWFGLWRNWRASLVLLLGGSFGR